MAESLQISLGSKEEKYEVLMPQIFSLLNGEQDLVANMANICAALKEQFAWLWVGFYLVKGDQLVLGPFQGPIACTRINFNKGVCGTAWARQNTIIVPDIDWFPGHIACSSASKSEIVVPLMKANQVLGVLDVDSAYLNSFDAIDQKYLEQIMKLIPN